MRPRKDFVKSPASSWGVMPMPTSSIDDLAWVVDGCNTVGKGAVERREASLADHNAKRS